MMMILESPVTKVSKVLVHSILTPKRHNESKKHCSSIVKQLVHLRKTQFKTLLL